jgi:glycosyltransferase involved in cell wall biosynthesis
VSREPQVSVVMPVYNGQRWLRQAVESILAQTLSDLEFIVVDDGSTDGSADTVQSYADPRIRLIRQANQGEVTARNNGTLAACGDYVTFLDADDLAEPQRLAVQRRFLVRHPEVAAAGCSVRVIDERGRPIFLQRAPTGVERCRRRLFAGRFYSYGACLMMRREGYLAAGMQRPYFRSQCDVDLMLRLAERRAIDNVPDVLYRYRINMSGLSQADPWQGPYYGEVAFQLHHERVATGTDRLQRGEWVAPYAREPRRNVRPATLRRVLYHLHLSEAQLLLECGGVWSALRHLARASALEPFRPSTARACWRLLRSGFDGHGRRS